MLVQFTLKNILSFKDETVFDMRAINAYKEHTYNLISSSGKESFLKVAAVYGANASGKSNLYLAMHYFSRLVTESMNQSDVDAPVLLQCYFPFAFDAESNPSLLEAVIEKNGFQYTYGFEYDHTEIKREWCYRRDLSSNRRSTLLERDADNIEFGATARKTCNKYKEEIRSNVLALTFLNGLKTPNPFHEAFVAIDTLFTVPDSIWDDKNFLESFLPTIILNEKENFISFLTALDTGIKDITYDDDRKDPIFLTTHMGQDGIPYTLNLFNESDGTIKCIYIYIHVAFAFESEKTVVIDELNVKLHPLLLKFIINLFYDSNSEAQLIYTTHDVTLLRKEYFRRDQIWFVDKDEYGHSELSALSDYKIRSDASFDKDYLGGVYGGIPHFTNFSFNER